MLALVVLGGAALIVSRRRARDGRSEVGEIDQTDDFVRLGDGIRALELDVTLGEAGPAAKADYDRALEAYDRANAHDRRGEEEAANRALDEGLAAIASARERIAGRRAASTRVAVGRPRGAPPDGERAAVGTRHERTRAAPVRPSRCTRTRAA